MRIANCKGCQAMTHFEEMLEGYKSDPEMTDFLLFVKNNMTGEQEATATRIETDDEFLWYLLSAYGAYTIPRRNAVPRLITNPEKLFVTKETKSQIVYVLKNLLLAEVAISKAEKALREKKE